MNLKKEKNNEKMVVFDLFGVVIDSHSKMKYNLSNARGDIAKKQLQNSNPV